MIISTTCHEKSTCHSLAEANAYTDEVHSDNNWEVLSDSDSGNDSPITHVPNVSLDFDALHRCKSSPNFSMQRIKSQKETDEFSDIDSYLDVRSLKTEGSQSVPVSSKSLSDDWSMISSSKGTLKKIPSFKDMLLKNSDSKQDQARIDLQEKLRQNVVDRKTITPTFVVSNVKVHPNGLRRCGFSTGDLQSSLHPTEKTLATTQGSTSVIPEEEEVWGDTDAMEFYHQKAMGSSSRSKSLKLRPDEAKRKEFSISKKEMHRRS